MPRRIPYYRPAGPVTSARSYETAPDRMEAKRFYAGARWLALRDSKLAADPLCECCRRKGFLTPARHVHHKVPRKERPDLAYDWLNLESLCIPCHNAQGAAGGKR